MIAVKETITYRFPSPSCRPSIRLSRTHVRRISLTEIFIGTRIATGLVWLDCDKEDATLVKPPDNTHLLYCSEIWGQIVCAMAQSGSSKRHCVFTRGRGGGGEVEDFQHELADHQMRLLEKAKVCTSGNLRD